MSKFKIQGTITKIGKKKEVANGAVVIDYVVDETAENGYVTPLLQLECTKKQTQAEFTCK
jgi:hypothetical protein